MAGLELVVLTNDHALYRGLATGLARHSSIHTTRRGWDEAPALQPAPGERLLVIDDQGAGSERAVAVMQHMRRHERNTPIVYLAARHSIELERQVRRVGVSYYADKSATGRSALLAIEAILRARQTPGAIVTGEGSGDVQPGRGAQEEEDGCVS